MNKTILVHGTGGSDKDLYWFDDTKAFLESRGFETTWPKLPNTDLPEIEESRSFLQNKYQAFLDEKTLIIAHSSGCPLVLDWLQSEKVKVAQVILVGGFYSSIDDEGVSEKMIPASGFDWALLSKLASEFVLINSDNDPWGCDDKQARQPAIELGAKLIINVGQGHMGSDSFNQPYREFKLLKRLIQV